MVTIHGEDSENAVVILGGRDKATVQRLRESLQRCGFRVETDVNTRLQGREMANVCNRGTRHAGIQIELSNGVRRSFFGSLRTRVGRQTKTERFWHCVEAVRRIQ